MLFETICNWIVLVGAVLVAISHIFRTFGKPFDLFKKKQEAEERKRIVAIMKEELPAMLEEHDAVVCSKYETGRDDCLRGIRDEVVEILKQPLSEQNGAIDILTRSSKDVLREKIMAIYHKNKEIRTLEYHEREALNQYYIDYKAMNGNSYIDKYYSRMKKWAVLPDDVDEDEEEK